MTINELQERLGSLNGGAHDIRAKSEAEKRDLTTEESVELDHILDAFDRTKADIDRLSKLEGQTALLNQPQGRRTQAEPPVQLAQQPAGVPPEPDVQPTGRRRLADTIPAQYRTGPQNGGFRSMGHFALSVHRASVEGGTTDPRLERLASASTYGSEIGGGADGGFAVPPDFRTEIMKVVMAEDSLLSRCDQITCEGNTFTCPVDETTPWQTSGGILANWDGEAAAATQTKPQLQERTVKLNKLRVLVPMTEELLEDAAAMDSYLRRKAPEKIAFKINQALIAGTGVGMPLGILTSTALVSVAEESGQQSGSIVAKNILNMYNRLYGPSRGNAVWLYNQEIEPQILKLSIPGTDNTGNFVTTWGVGLYLPPGGLSSTPYGTLMGRPMVPTQACSALSTKGDIIFADLSQYMALLKSGPNPRLDISIHLWFDQDLTAFKFVLRMGGMPWLSTPITALNGNNTYSHFVSLDSRP